MAATPTPTSILDIGSGAGIAQTFKGNTTKTFFSTVVTAVVIFAIEFGVFLIVKDRLGRIYKPRTYLVPERERTPEPPPGFWQWLRPVFQTSTSEFIQKSGLDAYFFLRYLRTLLKIFIPLAFVILPILLPMNSVHGRGPNFAVGIFGQNTTLYTNIEGFDQLAWGNVRPDRNSRYWAHLILAVFVVVYTCFIFFDELRGYIRLRQAYLTSPQHRLRASATTVLVTAIPPKWCTLAALNGLYDVFPGGIRNIWLNRNYDELNDKVKDRNSIALKLENAETNLIRNAKKAHMKKSAAEAKKSNSGSKEKRLRQRGGGWDGSAMADSPGISSGDPHQVHHTLDEALADSSDESLRESSVEGKRILGPIPLLGQGLEAVGHGIDHFGKSVFKGLKQVGKDVDGRLRIRGGIVPGIENEDNGSAVTEHDATPHDNNAATQTLERRDQEASSDSANTVDTQFQNSPNRDTSHQGTSGDEQVQDTQLQNSSNRDTSHQGTSGDEQVQHAISDSGLPQEPPRQKTRHVPGGGTHSHSGINERMGLSEDVLRNPIRLGEARDSENAAAPRKFWRYKRPSPFGIPSPVPHDEEQNEFPINDPNIGGARNSSRAHGAKQKKAAQNNRYLTAVNPGYDPNDDGEPVWKTYLTAKDREIMRLPIFGWSWMPALPWLGEKVDTIEYCRKELARLNVEIEEDQRHPEKYPLMNSAFIQFNHQVAAHMACQAVSHHTPNHMAPRLVEISPNDVIWDNMSIKWWEHYIRNALVFASFIGVIIGWAFPVTFTGLLSQIKYLASLYDWLHWLENAPSWVISGIQGILPTLVLAILLSVLPLILQFLAKLQGNLTGMGIQLTVQVYYFLFLFVQVFLVVSISSGMTTVISDITKGPQNIPSILAGNLPKASNYFFSYMLLQAMSVSAGALAQIFSLISWFILAPIFDSTARQKWSRQTALPQVQWGTFFPVYTNLAAIGLIYSVISPLILLFNIVTFSLFWFVYRYNTLYVTKFRFDTGGLLYPKAINQLFTGLYFMELCLIGLFFLVRNADEEGNAVGTPCKGQAIIMIVVLVFTVLFQILLNRAFAPLFRYLPITLEDEAVIRDTEFAKAQEKQWRLLDNEPEDANINELLEERARQSEDESRQVEDIEMKEIEAGKKRSRLDPRQLAGLVPGAVGNMLPARGSWAHRSAKHVQTRDSAQPDQNAPIHSRHRHSRSHQHSSTAFDPEGQRWAGTNRFGEALFQGIHDEIQDLTPEERDKLVQRAFQHEALRARRPVIWIPRDELGVSDDEIRCVQRQFAKNIWISNDYTGLDEKGRVVFRRSPPDFSEVDLIEL